MNVLTGVCAAAEGYLIGSLSIAILITSSFLKEDVRNLGSKNAGATNVARVFGMKLGAVTLLGDALKTVVAMLFGRLLAGNAGVLIAAAACMMGHCWPVYYGFRGGKGVAVAGAIALFYDWRVFLILVAIFALLFVLSKKVSVCSLLSAAAYPIGMALFGHRSWPELATALFITAVVWFAHRGNIQRLIAGTEPDFKPKK